MKMSRRRVFYGNSEQTPQDNNI